MPLSKYSPVFILLLRPTKPYLPLCHSSPQHSPLIFIFLPHLHPPPHHCEFHRHRPQPPTAKSQGIVPTLYSLWNLNSRFAGRWDSLKTKELNSFLIFQSNPLLSNGNYRRRNSIITSTLIRYIHSDENPSLSQ